MFERTVWGFCAGFRNLCIVVTIIRYSYPASVRFRRSRRPGAQAVMLGIGRWQVEWMELWAQVPQSKFEARRMVERSVMETNNAWRA